MLSELELLFDVTRRLEEAGLDYMLTGSMALNHYAQPRMTRDIDIVSKEDLILSKLDWARESQSQRQLSDVENLLATGADLNYLQTWSRKLNLTDMLTRVSP